MIISNRTRSALIIVHGIAMSGLGFMLLYIHAAMTNFFAEMAGSILAVFLIAGSLLLLSVLDGLCLIGVGLHKLRELRGYVLLSAASAALGLFCLLSPWGSFLLLCYFGSAYALFFGIGKLRLARILSCSDGERWTLDTLGVVAILFALALPLVAARQERDAIGMLGAYSLFFGAQMLLTTYFLRRHNGANFGHIRSAARS